MRDQRIFLLPPLVFLSGMMLCGGFSCDGGGGGNISWTLTTWDDVATTATDAPITIDVLANDPNLGLTVTGVSPASNGTVVLNSDGTITFTPTDSLANGSTEARPWAFFGCL